MFLLAVAAGIPASSFAETTSLFSDGLQAHFRTDDATTVNLGELPTHGGAVSFWRTQEGSGTPLVLARDGNVARPNWQTNAFQRADGTYRPAIRFVRNTTNTDNVKNSSNGSDITKMYLVSTNTTTLNLGTATTWFLVMNYLVDHSDGRVFGFMGGDPDPRFGAFVLSASSGINKLRLHNNSNPGNAGVVDMSVGGYLVDSRNAGTRMVGFTNGVMAVGCNTTAAARTTERKFGVGAMLADATSARFDCAELVVYSRALNDAEMRIVRTALSVRWGLPCADLLWTAAADGFCEDLSGVGSSTATGANFIPGTVETSGNAGGLSVSVPAGALDGQDAYLLVAHDGVDVAPKWDADAGILRLARIWRVESTLPAMPAVTVAVDGATVAPGATGLSCRLLYRADATHPFADTGLTGTSSGESVSFSFAAGAFKAGDYAVAITGGSASATVAPGTEEITVWYKSDAGVVTNENGIVTRWENQGSLGAEADVHAYTGTVTVVEEELVSADGTTKHPALQFATACLQTTNETSLGLSSATPSSWFVVFNPSSVASQQTDAGLFGLTSNNPRYGAFFPASDGGYVVRGFIGGNQLAQSVIPSAWHVIDMAEYPADGGGFKGSLSARGVMASLSALQNTHYFLSSARLKVGHFREDTWGKFFNGGIAELRVYKRPLNPIERMYVQKELSEKYGLAFNHPFWSGSETATATYRTDIQMTGLDNVHGAGGATGFASGGLIVSSEGAGERVPDVWLGHNGQAAAWTAASDASHQAKLSRDWHVAFARNPSDVVRLVFTEGAFAADEDYVLLYRKTDGSTAWSALPYAAEVAAGTVGFRLPLGAAQTGYYTVGKGTAPVASLPCAGVSSGLAGWFRADTGLEIENGTVAKWRNLGATGSADDMVKDGGSPVVASDGFPRTASGTGELSVRLNGTSYFSTDRKTDWNITGDLTWFCVSRLGDGVGAAERNGKGIFGNALSSGDYANGPRFGAFFSGNISIPLRTHAYHSGAGNYCNITGSLFNAAQPFVVDCRRYGKVADTFMDGKQEGKKSEGQAAVLKERFQIGKWINVACLNGDVAELRIYNRALNDAERAILSNHLAARYGIPMGDNMLYGGATAEAADCDLDVVGIGCAAKNGDYSVAGTVSVSESSAGFTLAAAGALAVGDYVLAGHGVKDNAWVSAGADVKRMKRAWHVTKTNAASLDLSLSFRMSDAGVGLLDAKEKPVYRLFRSLDGGATWGAVDVPLVRTAGGFTCTLPASAFAEGQYTLGAHVTPLGTMVIFR